MSAASDGMHGRLIDFHTQTPKHLHTQTLTHLHTQTPTHPNTSALPLQGGKKGKNHMKADDESKQSQYSEPKHHEKMPQDLPPAAGYSPVQWKRNLPSRGFRPKVFLLIIGSIVGWGWYRAIAGIQERRELTREKMWTRIHLMPLLIAEQDRDNVRRVYADKQRVKDIVGEDEASVYNDDKFRTPGFHWAGK